MAERIDKRADKYIRIEGPRNLELIFFRFMWVKRDIVLPEKPRSFPDFLECIEMEQDGLFNPFLCHF